MESVYLRTLIETVAVGSVSKAAEKLRVTPSAVSRRIKFLEDQYGCQLLDRSGSTIKPTEAGRLVIEKAIKILTIEKELMSGLRGIGDRQCVSFCCTPAFGIAYLPGILKSFMSADGKPGDMKILFGTPDDIVRRLQEHVVDIAVLGRCVDFDPKEYQEYPLPEEEMVFVSAPELGVKSGAVDLDALAPYRLFTRGDGCCSKITLDGNLRRRGEVIGRFGSITVCDDMHTIIDAVVNGGGIVYLSRSVVEGLLRDGTLRAHYVDGFVNRLKRTLFVREALRPDASRDAFAKAVFSSFNLDTPLS